MDYNKKLFDLLKEARTLVQYKRLPVIFRILLFIPMLPLIIHDALLIAGYLISAFIYQGISTPFNIVHDFVKKEREGVKDLAEAAICLIATPLLLIYQLFLALFSFGFYISWFFIMLYTYIITLGGIKWQPYIKEATFDNNLDGLTPAPSTKAAKTFALLLFFAPAISTIVCIIITIIYTLLAIVFAIVISIIYAISAALSSTGVGALIGVPLIMLTTCAIYLVVIPVNIIYYALCYIIASAQPILIFIVNPLIFKLKPQKEDVEDIHIG